MMDLKSMTDGAMALHHNGAVETGIPYPARLEAILGAELCVEAQTAISAWPGYAPTPLHRLDGLADQLGVGAIYYKDEGPRFGLGSFKALGGAYAVLKLLARELRDPGGAHLPEDRIAKGLHADQASTVTVVTATDGNHGRSVAWGARMFGAACRIYMHAGVSPGRAKAVEALGAKVVWVDGNYDASVRQAAQDAADNGWHIVSDTSYPGYMDLPRHVMAGYSVMVAEVIAQTPQDAAPTHVFLQGGVGGLAGAVTAALWHHYGAARPRVIVVEPDRAPCLYRSAVEGRPVAVEIVEETIMAGLSCGEVSLLAWDILAAGADEFMTVPDSWIAPLMRGLANPASDCPVVAGESAVAGLAGLAAVRQSPDTAAALGLDRSSRILVIGTEGATDPAIYEAIVGQTPQEIAA